MASASPRAFAAKPRARDVRRPRYTRREASVLARRVTASESCSSSRARTVVNASGGAEGDFMDAGELEREAAALEEAGDVRDAVDWEIQA